MSNTSPTFWRKVLLGSKRNKREARKLNMAQLAVEAEYRFTAATDQIALDVPRCDARMEDQKALSRILSVWALLNRGIGYYQGLNLLASALYSVFRKTSSHPEHDTLAALGTISRIHAPFVPMHAQDYAPLENAMAFAQKIAQEVICADSSLRLLEPHIIPYLQMFALRVLPVCFATFFGDSETLQIFWNYMFGADPGLGIESVIDRASARSRHILSALILQNSKLWKMNNDQKQNFCIFEAVISLTPPSLACNIVRAATHLEMLERLGGVAM